MEVRNILDLKVYAYMLLNIHFFGQREDKSTLESQLALVLKELVKIQSELSLLGTHSKSWKIIKTPTDKQDNELDDLIQKIRVRMKSLPQEPVGQDFSNELDERLASCA